MITQNRSQRIIVGAFLVIGTLLAAYLAIYYVIDGFFKHTTWMYRDDLPLKITLVGTYIDFVILTFAGIISSISFFKRGRIWKPITYGIIINIILWFLLGIFGFITVASFDILDILLCLIGVSTILLCILLLSHLWRIIKKIN